MGSVLHITSQLSTERSHLHRRAVFSKSERGEPFGEVDERKWTLPQAITIDEGEDEDWARRRPGRIAYDPSRCRRPSPAGARVDARRAHGARGRAEP
jgi:hypothetical protein